MSGIWGILASQNTENGLLNAEFVDFSLSTKAQNDNSGVDFSLVSLAQNDSSVDFSLRLRLASRLVAFYKRLKMTMPCRLCKSCICLVMKGKYTSYENLCFAINKNLTYAFDFKKCLNFKAQSLEISYQKRTKRPFIIAS